MTAYKASIGDKSFDIKIVSENELDIGGQIRTFDFCEVGENEFSLLLDGISYAVRLSVNNGTPSEDHTNGYGRRRFTLNIRGNTYEIQIDDHRSSLLRSFGKQASQSGGVRVVCAPMPGLIARIEVTPGEKIDVGKGLVVLEAMKMENEIRSIFPGTVREVLVQKGKPVEKGEPLVTILETS